MEFYLTVNADGVVSLWDEPIRTERTKGEVALTLQLTRAQEEVIHIAQDLAYINSLDEEREYLNG